jgi:hypothetical protein
MIIDKTLTVQRHEVAKSSKDWPQLPCTYARSVTNTRSRNRSRKASGTKENQRLG